MVALKVMCPMATPKFSPCSCCNLLNAAPAVTFYTPSGWEQPPDDLRPLPGRPSDWVFRGGRYVTLNLCPNR